jgi:small ubiquitin-related modifier
MAEPGASAQTVDPERITVKVRAQDGGEMHFKVKPTTKMERIFDAYATRHGLPLESLRFLLDGTRVKNDDTVKILELEEGDQIDCVVEQTGG